MDMMVESLSICISERMKLLVFAHTPPPHHGQSYMVQLMLEGFSNKERAFRKEILPETTRDETVECYHVNSRVSEDMTDLGVYRLRKVFLIVRYCINAVWLRFLFGLTH